MAEEDYPIFPVVTSSDNSSTLFKGGRRGWRTGWARAGEAMTIGLQPASFGKYDVMEWLPRHRRGAVMFDPTGRRTTMLGLRRCGARRRNERTRPQ